MGYLTFGDHQGHLLSHLDDVFGPANISNVPKHLFEGNRDLHSAAMILGVHRHDHMGSLLWRLFLTRTLEKKARDKLRDAIWDAIDNAIPISFSHKNPAVSGTEPTIEVKRGYIAGQLFHFITAVSD